MNMREIMRLVEDNVARSTVKEAQAKRKKQIPKELESLAAEANKYRSAEEFVKGLVMVYHGSQRELKNFEPRGAFFTHDFYNADGYASGEHVYEGYLNLVNPLVIDAKGRMWNDLKTPYGTSTQEVIGNVDDTKYDGIIFKNVKDSWIDDAEYQDPDTIYYAFNAKKAFLNEFQLIDLYNKLHGIVSDSVEWP